MSYRLPASPRPSARRFYVGVIPDTHVGYIGDQPTYSITAWDVALQALKHNAKRLTHVVLLGDFGNWESLSHWAALRAEQAFVEEDVALVNARLDELDALQALNRKGRAPIRFVYLEGNHEAWAGLFEAKYPALRDVVNLRRRLLAHRKNWTWVPENHYYAVGDLHATHGHVRGNRHPGDLCRTKGVSVIQGHTHALRTDSVRTLNGELEQWELGCLATIDPPPPYTRGATPASWVHAITFAQVRANGRFLVGPRRIQDEVWTELEDGTEIRADSRACQARYDADQRIREKLRREYGERYYAPGGAVTRLEPHHGKVSRKGEVSDVARTRRARIVRGG